MFKYIFSMNPIIQALLAGIMCHFFTTLGSSMVFFIKKDKTNILNIFISIASGIMLSAAIFSLLIPSIDISNSLLIEPYISIIIGFFLGIILITLFNILFDKISLKKDLKKNNLRKSLLLILSITIHNIPEGLAVGVAFGSVIYGIDGVTIFSAWMLALGIGIQNFPEGMTVSVPLLQENFTKKKAFSCGYLSGLVEPISSIIGALVVMKVKYLLPFLLSFASSAMLYVVVSELIPESQNSKNKNLSTLFFIIGFIIMLLLEIYI